MAENPYTAPAAMDGMPPALPGSAAEAEAIRRSQIGTEATIKSIGILYWLGALSLLAIAVAILARTISGTSESSVHAAAEATGGILLAALGMLQFFTGSGLRKLKPWSRVWAGVLSTIGLLAFPIGTIINAYILFTIFGRKGSMVFSPAYRGIIAATPHVKYKTSKLVWICLGLLVVLGLGILILGILGSGD